MTTITLGALITGPEPMNVVALQCDVHVCSEHNSGVCPGMRKERCAREARAQNLINIHLFVNITSFSSLLSWRTEFVHR